MQWRALTPDEIRSLPEARLGGALRWILAACVLIVAIPTAGFVLLCAVLVAGPLHSGPIEYLNEVYTGLVDLGTRYMIAIAVVYGWSLLFIVLTLLRSPATPLVASVGLTLWVGWRFAVGYAGQALLEVQAGRGELLERLIYHWPFAVDMLAELAMLAAFCGYMATGRRPNAYYRRRLPTG